MTAPDNRTIEIWGPPDPDEMVRLFQDMSATAPQSKQARPEVAALGFNAFLSRPKKTGEVDRDALVNNLRGFLAAFQKAVDDQPAAKSGYYVDEIVLNLGVSGKNGAISIITGIAMEAGITVKIKHRPQGDG